MRSRPSLRFTPILVAVVSGFLFAPRCVFAQKMPGATQGPSVAPTVVLGKADEYAGAERCRSCHKPEYREYEKTAHAKISVPGKDFVSGCEACHGPGKAHADAIEAAEGDDAKTAQALSDHPIFSFGVNQKITSALHDSPIFNFRSTAKENAAHCLLCHTSSKQQDFFEHSAHMAHGVACSQCHTSHLVAEVKDASKGDFSSPQGEFFQVPQLPDEVRWLRSSLLKQSEPELCFGCHSNVQAQFALPVHHRVPEGLVKCTDCHTPHGSLDRASLNQPNFQACVNCHAEKRGPYIYEHPAARVEGCTACHTPHGSPNRMLLVRHEGRQLCLQCHTGFHGQAGVPHGRLGFQTSGECTRCHTNIHGSNLDPTLLR